MLSLKKIDSLYPLISQNSRIYKEKQKELKQKEVLDNLYSLPLDIKIKIYQMAMSTHLKEWTNDHKSISWSLRRKLNPNDACCADLDIWNFIELEDRINQSSLKQRIPTNVYQTWENNLFGKIFFKKLFNPKDIARTSYCL